VLTEFRQVFGTTDVVHNESPGNHTRTDSERNSPHPEGHNNAVYRKAVSESGSEASGSQDYHDETARPTTVSVVARVSTHALREERAYHICKNLIKKVDPDGNHIIRPMGLARLPSQQEDSSPQNRFLFRLFWISLLVPQNALRSYIMAKGLCTARSEEMLFT
jgi:hypothetical protein